MAKKKAPEKTQEELAAERRERDINDAKKQIDLIGLPKTDRKIFSVGESVITSHNGQIEATITEIVSEGVYDVHIVYNGYIPRTNTTKVMSVDRILTYPDIFKKEDVQCDLEVKKEFRINFMQQTVSSLVSSYVHYFGVDFDPEYQRELVWTEEDEVSLIESIFNHVDIGKFVFIQRPYNVDRKEMYEILDGKQRLTALSRFYTDQFKYKGYYYSQLSWALKYHFINHPVSVAVLNKDTLTQKEIYDYFLRLNMGGKAVNVEHLNKVKDLYNKS